MKDTRFDWHKIDAQQQWRAFMLWDITRHHNMLEAKS
jgi:hypothetical protein